MARSSFESQLAAEEHAQEVGNEAEALQVGHGSSGQQQNKGPDSYIESGREGILSNSSSLAAGVSFKHTGEAAGATEHYTETVDPGDMTRQPDSRPSPRVPAPLTLPPLPMPIGRQSSQRSHTVVSCSAPAGEAQMWLAEHPVDVREDLTSESSDDANEPCSPQSGLHSSMHNFSPGSYTSPASRADSCYLPDISPMRSPPRNPPQASVAAPSAATSSQEQTAGDATLRLINELIVNFPGQASQEARQTIQTGGQQLNTRRAARPVHGQTRALQVPAANEERHSSNANDDDDGGHIIGSIPAGMQPPRRNLSRPWHGDSRRSPPATEPTNPTNRNTHSTAHQGPNLTVRTRSEPMPPPFVPPVFDGSESSTPSQPIDVEELRNRTYEHHESYDQQCSEQSTPTSGGVYSPVSRPQLHMLERMAAAAASNASSPSPLLHRNLSHPPARLSLRSGHAHTNGTSTLQTTLSLDQGNTSELPGQHLAVTDTWGSDDFQAIGMVPYEQRAEATAATTQRPCRATRASSDSSYVAMRSLINERLARQDVLGSTLQQSQHVANPATVASEATPSSQRQRLENLEELFQTIGRDARNFSETMIAAAGHRQRNHQLATTSRPMDLTSLANELLRNYERATALARQRAEHAVWHATQAGLNEDDATANLPYLQAMLAARNAQNAVQRTASQRADQQTRHLGQTTVGDAGEEAQASRGHSASWQAHTLHTYQQNMQSSSSQRTPSLQLSGGGQSSSNTDVPGRSAGQRMEGAGSSAQQNVEELLRRNEQFLEQQEVRMRYFEELQNRLAAYQRRINSRQGNRHSAEDPGDLSQDKDDNDDEECETEDDEDFSEDEVSDDEDSNEVSDEEVSQDRSDDDEFDDQEGEHEDERSSEGGDGALPPGIPIDSDSDEAQEYDPDDYLTDRMGAEMQRGALDTAEWRAASRGDVEYLRRAADPQSARQPAAPAPPVVTSHFRVAPPGPALQPDAPANPNRPRRPSRLSSGQFGHLLADAGTSNVHATSGGHSANQHTNEATSQLSCESETARQPNASTDSHSNAMSSFTRLAHRLQITNQSIHFSLAAATSNARLQADSPHSTDSPRPPLPPSRTRSGTNGNSVWNHPFRTNSNAAQGSNAHSAQEGASQLQGSRVALPSSAYANHVQQLRPLQLQRTPLLQDLLVGRQGSSGPLDRSDSLASSVSADISVTIHQHMSDIRRRREIILAGLEHLDLETRAPTQRLTDRRSRTDDGYYPLQQGAQRASVLDTDTDSPRYYHRDSDDDTTLPYPPMLQHAQQGSGTHTRIYQDLAQLSQTGRPGLPSVQTGHSHLQHLQPRQNADSPRTPDSITRRFGMSLSHTLHNLQGRLPITERLVHQAALTLVPHSMREMADMLINDPWSRPVSRTTTLDDAEALLSRGSSMDAASLVGGQSVGGTPRGALAQVREESNSILRTFSGGPLTSGGRLAGMHRTGSEDVRRYITPAETRQPKPRTSRQRRGSRQEAHRKKNILQPDLCFLHPPSAASQAIMADDDFMADLLCSLPGVDPGSDMIHHVIHTAIDVPMARYYEETQTQQEQLADEGVEAALDAARAMMH